jgi:hypothetical protein
VASEGVIDTFQSEDQVLAVETYSQLPGLASQLLRDLSIVDQFSFLYREDGAVQTHVTTSLEYQPSHSPSSPTRILTALWSDHLRAIKLFRLSPALKNYLETTMNALEAESLAVPEYISDMMIILNQHPQGGQIPVMASLAELKWPRALTVPPVARKLFRAEHRNGEAWNMMMTQIIRRYDSGGALAELEALIMDVRPTVQDGETVQLGKLLFRETQIPKIPIGDGTSNFLSAVPCQKMVESLFRYESGIERRSGL